MRFSYRLGFLSGNAIQRKKEQIVAPDIKPGDKGVLKIKFTSGLERLLCVICNRKRQSR